MLHQVGVLILLIVSVRAQDSTQKGEGSSIVDDSLAAADPYNYDPYYG